MTELSPEIRRMSVRLYARTGVHCDTATLIYRNAIPEELQAECDRERASYLADQGEWEMRWGVVWG